MKMIYDENLCLYSYEETWNIFEALMFIYEIYYGIIGMAFRGFYTGNIKSSSSIIELTQW